MRPVAVLKNDDQLLSNVIASQIESLSVWWGRCLRFGLRHLSHHRWYQKRQEEAGITEADVTACGCHLQSRPG